MGLVRSTDFDRNRLLEAAAKARSRRRRRKAIGLYRWVLAVEPRNADLHLKLAPLLAEIGQDFDAWTHFRAAAKACQRTGQLEKALAVYREAALYLPREYQVWQAVAHLQRQRGHDEEAIDTLLEGSRQLRPRWLRPQAIYLLRRAREIDAWRFDVVLEMARLLGSCEQHDEARILLEGLAKRAEPEQLRRVRGAQLRMRPGFGTFWRWLRAALRPEAGAPAREPRSPAVVPLRRAARR